MLPDAEPTAASAVVYRGSKTLCREFSLVLEAKGIEHEVRENADAWVVAAAPSSVHRAYEEISRYSAERSVPRSVAPAVEPFGGAGIGAAGFVLVLLLTAYCAAAQLF